MTKFRKRVTKSRKRTSCFHYKNNIDKKFWEALRCIFIISQNFISIEVVVHELNGGFTEPPALGSRYGSETPWAGEGKIESFPGHHSIDDVSAGINSTSERDPVNVQLKVVSICGS